MGKHITSISKDAFEALKPGDGIKDRYGRVWIVHHTNKGRFAPVRHWMKCYEEDLLMGLIWLGHQIIEEGEYAVQLDLTHPSAEVQPMT